MNTPLQQIILASPRGFCAGVDRAISIVERALEKFGAPIYVRHEVVHNRFVVDNLKEKGAIFIDDLKDVPAGSTLIYSAHGVSLAVREEAESLGLTIFDATCPLVTKVHLEVRKLRKEGFEIIMIGHEGHPEVEGTMGQTQEGMYLVETADDVQTLAVQKPDQLAYVTQTTLSVDDASIVIDALRAKFPNIVGPKKDDICYATQNRQDAVKQLTTASDLIIVIGSKNSSNSNRLREVAEQSGVTAYMVDNASELKPEWFEKATKVGITAGASAPEVLVNGVVERIQSMSSATIDTLKTVDEDVVFNLPKGL
ncbi:4-hydroxy-3-methylbut-2-enyl diphosphate reductase [Leeia sp. TBRC 13508]|uniref:4-hydroxy-3-methylbut-2-enyl diphosphate reductase n=1 Tax=Leeia speluncae TaxID=2884804 RepID=A0ABS8D5V2_9NEIS|nr:4-hydroxy-3-methylbut-2-enyl diphosphate reductase [Leeia speluncae]MCB6183562.1 4-hydroxy-3-methylbut-2-enyl diphosphate reductase [Leeia speluncae]